MITLIFLAIVDIYYYADAGSVEIQSEWGEKVFLAMVGVSWGFILYKLFDWVKQIVDIGNTGKLFRIQVNQFRGNLERQPTSIRETINNINTGLGFNLTNLIRRENDGIKRLDMLHVYKYFKRKVSD